MPELVEGRRKLRDLKAIDERALDFVYGALADDDPGVRREAVRLIARSPASTGLILMLERALTDENELGRRSAAMEALAAMGKPALPLLSRLAADPRVGVRRLAVDALGLSRLPDAVDVLERCARDSQAAVRSAALEAVAKTGAPRAAAILLRAIEERSEQPAVVLAALLGVLGLGKTPPVHTLKRLVADPLTAPPALRLLGRAGEAAFLVDALTTSTGSKQRAAVQGLAEALEIGASTLAGAAVSGPVMAPANLNAPGVRAALRKVVEASDVQVACAALVVSAYGGDVEILVTAAARDDRAAMSSAAHRAVAVLRESRVDLPEQLRMLAADDAPGTDLLLELADAAERGRARATTPAAQVRLDDRSFARLSRLLEQAAGLAITDDARVRLEARLLPRVDETGADDFPTYLDMLARPEGKAELKRALELVTVHETYFFRERAQLTSFQHDVIERWPYSLTPRIWSAGTSTGEEAYTLSILCESAGRGGVTSSGGGYEVVGTDLSQEAIEAARAGRYFPRSFRGDIDAPIRKRWFIYELGGVMVHPDLKRQTRFEVVNLLDDAETQALAPFDAIFCRNVLIYMSAQARARVIDLFWRKLKPGGLLLLGHSESLLHIETPFKLKALSRGLAYEKAHDKVIER